MIELNREGLKRVFIGRSESNGLVELLAATRYSRDAFVFVGGQRLRENVAQVGVDERVESELLPEANEDELELALEVVR